MRWLAASISPTTPTPGNSTNGRPVAGLRLRSRHHRAVPAVLQAVQAGTSKSSPRPGPSSANPTHRCIAKLIQAKPQALFTLLYAGDLSAFVNQGNVYALFSQMTVATPNVDYPVLAAIKNLPAGISRRHAASRPSRILPPTRKWGQAYLKKWNERPTNWSWRNSVAMQFYEQAIKKANSLDGKALAAGRSRA